MMKKQFRYENKNGVNFKSNNVSKENFMAQTVSTNKIFSLLPTKRMNNSVYFPKKGGKKKKEMGEWGEKRPPPRLLLLLLFHQKRHQYPSTSSQEEEETTASLNPLLFSRYSA